MIQQGKRATIGMQCAGGGCDNRRVWLLANSVLVEDAKWKSAVIGKQCAGGRCDNNSARCDN
jgi:hypothetical protein